MIVKLDLDPKLVWRLDTEAERQGMKLQDYLVGLAIKERDRKSVMPMTERQERIVELHGEGFTDVEIAEQLGCVRAYVTQIRGRFGLESNGSKRKRAA